MRLYALCDQDMLDSNGISVEQYIELAKDNSAEIIQYRNKNSDIDFIKKQLLKIKKIYDGTLLINDFYELVEYCDGIHLGQQDLTAINEDKNQALTYLKNNISKNKIIGLSTHNKEEVLESNNLDLDYIGLGAYRATATKVDVNTILGDSLDEIASYSKHNVAVIGGVNKDDKFKNISYHVIGSGLIK